MGKMIYRRVVRWLAENDEPENKTDTDYLRGSMCVALGAAITKEEPDKIAADVLKWRTTPHTGGAKNFFAGQHFTWKQKIPEGYITLEDAANMLGLSMFMMRDLCRRNAGPDNKTIPVGTKRTMRVFRAADIESWATNHAGYLAWHKARWATPARYTGADAPTGNQQKGE